MLHFAHLCTQLFIVSALVFASLADVRAVEELALPAEALAIVDRFVTDGAKQVTDADAKRMTAKAKLDTALENVQSAEGKAGRLESALAVKKLRTDVTGGKTIDPTKPGEGLPKAVQRPLETYLGDTAKIDKEFTAKMASMREQSLKDLEIVKVAQTKAGHLDVALVVKQTQDQLRSGQPAAKAAFNVLVFGKGAMITPSDDNLLRRGGSDSTIEALITTVTTDGLIFRCGGGGNGQSLALMKDEVWYAVAGRSGTLVKCPLGGVKPPLHLAVTFAKGEIIVWVNGTPTKHEKTELDAIGDNAPGGGLGSMGENGNNAAMPREGFSGELACFRYVDRVVYTAAFKPMYPLAASDAIRWQVDAQGLQLGQLKELPKSRIAGELSVKR